MNREHLKRYVIEPVLYFFNKHSQTNLNYLMEQAEFRSKGGKHLIALKGGKERGIFMVDPKDAERIIENYPSIKTFMSQESTIEDNLISNLRFCTAVFWLLKLEKEI